MGHARPLPLVALALVAAGGIACDDGEAPARPQLVVVLDTDAALVGQLGSAGAPAASPGMLTGAGVVSPALAIDSVRIDLVSDEREVRDYRDFTAPDPRDWPLSFGIASTPNTRQTVRLRIRAFRATHAGRGVLGDVTTIEPEPTVTIDRIVEVPQPEREVRTVRILLSASCFGAPASFQTPLRSCIDGARRSGAPTEGILEGPATTPTLAGTAREAREHRCIGASPSGAVCIAGGPSLLGDPRLSGILDGVPSGPHRPVFLSPFHMDRTEFTVGRYRTLLGAGKVRTMPKARGTGELDRYCTWLDASSPTNDRLPLNCVTYDAALAACAADGGTLPTEAQWEHAARGRGRGWVFPWGDTDPTCCTASASRPSVLTGDLAECGKIEGLEVVGSHAGKGCVPEDVSIDDVVDLAGSVKEMLLDGGVPYADGCWNGPGLVTDPRCALTDLELGRTSRGGEWSAGLGVLRSAFRALAPHEANTVGFRCVYGDKP